ncbi:MAG: SUMF1/EgtB/PvdO family nonheme iron enzyme [Hyphomonadaceae bacterium]|nr:SUMF1/EgtB/PvdO family nonheme iron enzyme [Hyphomonadaceae bacterium]
MPKIFISYRREDSQYQADRLHAALKPHVGNPKRDIFIDVDNIPVGVDFVEHLDRQVAQCDVLLAVIGPNWLNVQNPKTGKRRLDDPEDFVRIEIASALKRGIPVAPVLLDGAPIPSKEDLPEDLKALARRHGVEVRRASFDDDAERLIRGLGLKEIVQEARPAAAPSQSSPPAGSGAGKITPLVALGALLIIGGGGWIWLANSGDLGRTGGVPSAGSQLFEETAAPNTGQTDNPPSLGSSDTASLPAPAAPAPAILNPAPKVATITTYGVGETFRDCTGCPQMVTIPPGSFTMGSPADEVGRNDAEGPQRRVSVPAFAAGKYEVTWAEWERCVSDGGCAELTADGFGGGSRPVTYVSWTEAKTYVAWLSRDTGKTYRLLSEAEWEYAARAGTTTAYSFGNSISTSQANLRDGPRKTTPVGQYSSNAFGLHDMHGNVGEWVEDCWADNYSAGQPTDGRAYIQGSCPIHVIRGGSWENLPQYLRSAYRYADEPTIRNNYSGVRVARTLS